MEHCLVVVCVCLLLLFFRQWSFRYPKSASKVQNQANRRCISAGAVVYQGRYLEAGDCSGVNDMWSFEHAL